MIEQPNERCNTLATTIVIIASVASSAGGCLGIKASGLTRMELTTVFFMGWTKWLDG